MIHIFPVLNIDTDIDYVYGHAISGHVRFVIMVILLKLTIMALVNMATNIDVYAKKRENVDHLQN